MKKRDLTDDERRIWQAIARQVRPLESGKPPDPAAPPQATHEAFRAALDAPPLPRTYGSKPEPLPKPEIGDEAHGSEPKAALGKARPASPRGKLHPPQSRIQDRKVKRGQIPIDASFDLHGHTQASAARVLPLFLHQQRGLGAKCVIVITGKGRTGEGILRRNFLLWLETSAAQTLVSGYAPAHARHGGSGAWYVFLRRL